MVAFVEMMLLTKIVLVCWFASIVAQERNEIDSCIKTKNITIIPNIAIQTIHPESQPQLKQLGVLIKALLHRSMDVFSYS